MSEKTYLVDSTNVNPYHNQAVLAYLLDHIPDDSFMVFLWKDIDSINLGNQESVYNICSIDMLEYEHCYISRALESKRTSYNDLGCFNFAFISHKYNFNLEKQLSTIYQALSKLDLPVYFSKENELMLANKQISDHSVYMQKDVFFHRQSIYWDCDKSKRARLLKDQSLKMNYTNITDIDPCINMVTIRQAFLQAVADTYGPIYSMAIMEDFEDYIESYRNLKYIYQSDNDYTLLLNVELLNDSARLYVNMNKKTIKSIDVYLKQSDSVDAETIQRIFSGLYIDDVEYRNRIFNLSEVQRTDLDKIYQTIKKNCYQL